MDRPFLSFQHKHESCMFKVPCHPDLAKLCRDAVPLGVAVAFDVELTSTPSPSLPNSSSAVLAVSVERDLERERETAQIDS